MWSFVCKYISLRNWAYWCLPLFSRKFTFNYDLLMEHSFFAVSELKQYISPSFLFQRWQCLNLVLGFKSCFLTKIPLESRMQYSVFPGMLLLDRSCSNEPERLAGWKSKSSEGTKPRCQGRRRGEKQAVGLEGRERQRERDLYLSYYLVTTM